jgi:hypothetical protein
MAVFEQPTNYWPWSFVGAYIYDPPGEILLYYNDPDTNRMMSKCFQDTDEANEFVYDNGIKQYNIYRKIESDDEEYTSHHKFVTQPYWDVGSQVYSTDDDVDAGDTVYICYPEEPNANAYQTREDAAQRLQELQSKPRDYTYHCKVYQATISS